MARLIEGTPAREVLAAEQEGVSEDRVTTILMDRDTTIEPVPKSGDGPLNRVAGLNREWVSPNRASVDLEGVLRDSPSLLSAELYAFHVSVFQ